MTISHYYKCDFCGAKRYVSDSGEATRIKHCPCCENEYAPYNLFEEISQEEIKVTINYSSFNNYQYDYKADSNKSSLFIHSPDCSDLKSKYTTNNDMNIPVRRSRQSGMMRATVPDLWSHF